MCVLISTSNHKENTGFKVALDALHFAKFGFLHTLLVTVRNTEEEKNFQVFSLSWAQLNVGVLLPFMFKTCRDCRLKKIMIAAPKIPKDPEAPKNLKSPKDPNASKDSKAATKKGFKKPSHGNTFYDGFLPP